MPVRNLYRLILYLVFFAAALAVAGWRLPAYASRMPWLLLMAIADFYLMWRLQNPLFFFNRLLKILLRVLSILPSTLLLCFLFSMAWASPIDWNPVLRTYLLGFAIFLYVVRVFPLLVFLFHDIRSSFPANNRNVALQRIKPALNVSLVFSLLTAILMLAGATFWLYDFEVVEEKITVPGLSDQLDGYRIVHISDLHLGRWHSAKPLERSFELVNDMEPDLIAFTGDLVNYSAQEALPYLEVLGSLTARDGIFAIAGNHDYGDYMRWPDEKAKNKDIALFREIISKAGWILLENRNQTILFDNQCITIAGTGNFSTKKHFPNRADLNSATQDIPDSCLLILLTHTPEIIDEDAFEYKNIALMLAGHTHALQLGWRKQSRGMSPAALIYRYWGGLYKPDALSNGAGYLYVNRGLGHIAMPLRIGMKPEITLLTLEKQPVHDNGE